MKKLDCYVEEICSRYVEDISQMYTDTNNGVSVREAGEIKYNRYIFTAIIGIIGLIMAIISIDMIGSSGIFNIIPMLALMFSIYSLMDTILSILTLQQVNLSIKNINKNISNILILCKGLILGVYEEDDINNVNDCIEYLDRSNIATLNVFISKNMIERKTFVIYNIVKGTLNDINISKQKYFDIKTKLIWIYSLPCSFVILWGITTDNDIFRAIIITLGCMIASYYAIKLKYYGIISNNIEYYNDMAEDYNENFSLFSFDIDNKVLDINMNREKILQKLNGVVIDE